MILPIHYCTLFLGIQTYLPELLARILSTHTLQDLRTTGMLIHELGHVVHGPVDGNVQPVVDAVVGREIFGGEGLGHLVERSETWIRQIDFDWTLISVDEGGDGDGIKGTVEFVEKWMLR